MVLMLRHILYNKLRGYERAAPARKAGEVRFDGGGGRPLSAERDVCIVPGFARSVE